MKIKYGGYDNSIPNSCEVLKCKEEHNAFWYFTLSFLGLKINIYVCEEHMDEIKKRNR